MSANYYIFNFQVLNRILNNSEDIDIRWWDNISNISMNEDLARLKAHDLIGWNSGVRTTNPKILRYLNFDKLRKIIGLFLDAFLSPLFVIE
jgi:hypothetical protein